MERNEIHVRPKLQIPSSAYVVVYLASELQPVDIATNHIATNNNDMKNGSIFLPSFQVWLAAQKEPIRKSVVD